METESPKAAPILEIAWTRYAQLNASSLRRTNANKRLRIWIAALGVRTYWGRRTDMLARPRVTLGGNKTSSRLAVLDGEGMT